MRALALLSAPSANPNCMTIGVEDGAGQVYRVVHTSGLYETVRIFESARELGFGIGDGKRASGHTLQRVLRRND
jgi:hypothetical protein